MHYQHFGDRIGLFGFATIRQQRRSWMNQIRTMANGTFLTRMDRHSNAHELLFSKRQPELSPSAS
jgi:hypothetical protein